MQNLAHLGRVVRLNHPVMNALLGLLRLLVGLFLDPCGEVFRRFLLVAIHQRLTGFVRQRNRHFFQLGNQLRIRRCRQAERLAIQRENDFGQLCRASIDITSRQRNEHRRLRSVCAAAFPCQRAIQSGRLCPLRTLPFRPVRVINPEIAFFAVRPDILDA